MTKINRRQLLKASAATVASVSVAGCGGGGGGGTVNPDKSLVQQAKNEGKLTLYTVTDQPAMNDTINPAFQEDYPGIDVQVVALGPSEIASRMSSEYQAGQVQADVGWNTQGTMAPLIANDVFRAPGKDSYVRETLRTMNYNESKYTKHWFPGSTIPQVFMYNSNNVSESEAPGSWSDLGNSKWKGRIAMDRPSSLNVAGSVFATLYGTMDESEWKSLMQSIASNNPTFTESASDTFRVLAQGEADIGIGLLNNVLSAQKEGQTPVRVKWLKPTTYLNVPVYLGNDSPNPAAGMLYASWLMSTSGQEAIAATGRVPAHNGVASYTFDAIPSDVDLRPQAYKTPSYFKKPDTWVDRFKGIFG